MDGGSTETSAVKDVDLASFGSAVDTVLDDSQTFLGFPTETPDNAPPPAASKSLKYEFQGSLNAVLDASWEIFPSFILDQVTLALNLNLSSFRKYSLGVQLQATFTVQDVQFLVTGTIPDLQSQAEVDFTLTLQLSDPQSTLDARQFLPAIDSSLSFDNAFAPATDDIKSQLSGSASWVAGVTLVVHRAWDGQKATYFLKSVSLSVEAGFDWSPAESVHVTDVSVVASMSRTAADAPWTYLVHLAGSLSIQDTVFIASVDFDIADTSTFTLSLQLDSFTGVTIADVLDAVTPGTSDQSVSAVKAQLPPDLTFLGTEVDSGMNSLSVQIICSNTGSAGWSLSSVMVRLLLPGVVWQSPSENNNASQYLTFKDVYLLASVTHVVSAPAATTVQVVPHSTLTDPVTGHSVVSVHRMVLSSSTTTWNCKGLLGGTIDLRNGQFTLAAQVSYDSASSLLTVYATLPDGVYGPLSALAGDSSFSPAGVDPPVLGDIAAQAPVPSESPVQLSDVDDMMGGGQRGLWLTFSDEELKRVLLKASYSGSWAITDAITITDLGIMFDLQNPQSNDPLIPTTVAGYVYGAMTVAQSVNLFAFVAGRTDQTSTEFWVSLSATLVPGGPLSANPTTVVSDGQLLGYTPPTDGWGLPDTFPSSVSDALTSTGAFLDLKFVKNTTGSYELTLLQLQAFTTSSWQIFNGFTLTSVELDIYMQKAAASEPFAGYISFKGVCEVDVTSNPYEISVAGSFQRSLQAPDQFTLNFQVTQAGNPNVMPSDITYLSMFGGKPIDQGQLSGKIPADYPIQPTVFSNPSAYQLSCTATVVRSQQGNWGLDTLTFAFSQTADWVITSNLTLVGSTLKLQIQNPGGSSPTYTLLAQGTLKIGTNISLTASVQLATDSSKNGWLKISVIGNYQNSPVDLLTSLVSDSTITVPSGCPVTPGSASAAFTADLYMTKNSQNNWNLQEIDLVVDANGSWSIGSSNSLVVGSLKMYATFQNLTAAQPTKLVAFRGLAAFDSSSTSASAVAVTVTLVQTTLTVSVDIFAQTSVSAGNIMSKYVTNWSSTLGAPNLTNDTGLSDYGSKAVASAAIAFSQVGSSFRPDTITIGVGTGSGFNGWQIVEGYLVMTSLSLSLVVTNLSSSPSLQAVLSSNLQYLSREQVQTNLNMTLLATTQSLSCHVSLGGCNLAEALYVATAGRWNVPGDWPSLKSLDLYMNWSQGKGNFTATMEDWTIAGNNTIVSMTNPRLTLSVSRATSNLAASGQLAGEATVFSKIVIPITYDLPDGPLKIFGLDVKEIYEMCRRLLQLITDLEELCLILADIIGLGEGLEVGLALIALGCGISVVWEVIKKIFNYDHDDDDGDDSDDDDSDGDSSQSDDRTNQNSDPSKTSVWPWVVGGSGFCAGTSEEVVQLLMYPKTTSGGGMIIDTTKLSVAVGGGQSITTFTPIAGNGVSCNYVRPTALGNYSLSINYPPTAYASVTTLSVNSSASVLASNSLLDVSHNVLVGVVSYGTIWPKDQFGNALLGMNLRDLFTVTFDPPPAVSPEYIYFNDSVRFSYIPSDSSYNITAKLDGQNLIGSPVQVTAGYSADVTKSIAGGLGLCSGKAGEEVSFQVTILDQTGNPYPTGACQVTLSSDVDLDAPAVSIVGHTDNVYIFGYTRPAAGSNFAIQILIDGTPMPDCPINLTSTTDDVSLSVSNSILTVKSPYYAGIPINGTLTCFDTLSGLWMDNMNVSSFTASLIFGTQTTAITLQEVGNGTITFALNLAAVGEYQIVMQSRADSTVSAKFSPLSLTVIAAPVISDYRCYGPGLSLGTTLTSTYFNMLPLDQYGNVWNSALPATPPNILAKTSTTESMDVTTIGKAYRVVYTPPNTPNSFLRVTASGLEILESPFLLNNVGTATGGSVSWQSHNLNDISNVLVFARDANRNRLWTGGDLVSVSSTDPDSRQWPFVVLSVKDLQDGSYRVTYVPQQLDGVFNIALNGVACDGSPYTLPGQSQISYTATGSGISSAILGHNMTFTMTGKMNGNVFDDSTIFKSGVIYPLDTSSPNVVPVGISPSGNSGSSTVNYTVPTSSPLGLYKLKFWANYSQVIGSPFAVQVITDPVLTVQGLDWFGAATLPGVTSSSFAVLAGPSVALQPQLLVVLASNPQAVSCIVRAQSDTTLHVDFQVLASGAYTLSMSYNGKVISQPNGQGVWNLVAVDQNLSLQTWLPVQPAMAWTSGGTGEVQEIVSSLAVPPTVEFAKKVNESGNNQSASSGWMMPSLSVGNEFIFAYRMRWKMDYISEAEFRAPSASGFNRTTVNLLRYYNGSSFWTVYDNSSQGWNNQRASSINPDGNWHDILYHVGPDALRIYEDGQEVLTSYDIQTSPPSSPSFDFGCQVFDQGGVIDAVFESFVTCPGVCRPGAASASQAEIMFNLASMSANSSYISFYPTGGPINVQYTPTSVRFYQPTSSQFNAVAGGNSTVPLRPVAAIQYRFKCNSPGGGGCTINLAGNISLQIPNGGTPQWQYQTGDGQTLMMSQNTNFVAGGGYVTVFVVLTPVRAILYENGMLNFDYVSPNNVPGAVNPQGLFSVFTRLGNDQTSPTDIEFQFIRIVSGFM